MKRSLTITAVLMLSIASQSQTVKGSIQQGASPSTVNIVYLPDHNSLPGEYVNYLSVSIAIPTSEARGAAPAIASAGIFSSAISFNQAVPFSYTSGDETIYSWICPNNTSFSMSWKNGVSFVGAIVTFQENAIPSKVKLVDLTKDGKGGANQNTAFNVGVNVAPFDLTDYRDFFFTIIGENGSAEGTYSTGDRFVETSLSKNIVNNNGPVIPGISGLYPNPARDKINVIINATQKDNMTLIVTDMLGKKVKQQLVNVETGSNTVPVDIANLAQGSYMVKVLCKTSDCEIATGKFNKE